MLSHLHYKDKLTMLFCLVDDLLALLPSSVSPLACGKGSGGRHPKLRASEVLSLALFRFWTSQANWKAFYGMLSAGFLKEFPNLPCYETLLRQVTHHGPLGLLLLIVLLGQGDSQGSYALDATALPVSRHGRRAKVVRQWADWGRDSEGHWFFGFKLHAVCDSKGRLLSLRLTPGNVADVTQAESLLMRLRGLAVADAAYISQGLRQKLYEVGLLLLMPLRKNMKGLASPDQLRQLKGRIIIETVFSVLKERLGLVTSLPRSLDGYLVHYVTLILAYQLIRWVDDLLYSPALPQP
jgi:IS5 family transposase